MPPPGNAIEWEELPPGAVLDLSSASVNAGRHIIVAQHPLRSLTPGGSHMQIKKIAAALVISAALLGGLSACGDRDNQNQNQNNQQQNQNQNQNQNNQDQDQNNQEQDQDQDN